ncbi:MAG TPA: hypothetical protein DDZ11_12735 [Lentisphaeria bacterium]|nr:hypothetical protein [Lentisphaeria bacterium]
MNNSQLSVFKFEETALVRSIIKNGDPWFVAKDICDVLGLSNPTVALNALDQDERSKFLLGRQGETNIINESGLYALIFRSNKPNARKFRKWITSEVLPSIRKTGKYAAPVQPELPLAETQETPDVAALLKMRYRGVPVIPNADLAAALGLTTRQLAHVKSRNNIYTEGLDVFSVGIPKKLKHSIRRAGFASSASRTLLWTESGVRKLLQMLGASKTPYKPLPCSAPVPAKAPETPMIPGLALRKTEKTEERIYNFRLENLLNLDGLPKLRKLLGALHRAGYDVANEFAELSFVENVAHRMAEWQKQFERTLAFNLAEVRMLGRTRYVSKVTLRNGEFAKSESGFEGDVPKMEVPL